jgi:hypothetical protein
MAPTENGSSNNFSARMNDYMRSCGIKDDRKQFYSLRHSFAETMNRAGLDSIFRLALMGHAHDSDAARSALSSYGGLGHPIHGLYRIIAKDMQFPDFPGVDVIPRRKNDKGHWRDGTTGNVGRMRPVTAPLAEATG